MNQAMFVTNQRSSYVPAKSGVTLKKTISSAVVPVASDAALDTPLVDGCEVLLVQNQGNDVYMTLHGDDPASGTGILIVANTIMEMSRAQWRASRWIRSTADATLIAFQLRARG